MTQPCELLPLAWKKQQKTYTTTELQKAVYRIFSSSDGHILWTYLQNSILDITVSLDASFPILNAVNARRHLILTIKNLATRGKEI